MGALLQFSFNFQTITCCKCETIFAIHETTYNNRKVDGKSFWCTNGHEQHFTESKIKILENQLKYANETKDRYYKWYKQEDRRRAAMKGQLTKVKNRIGNGICPCCNRSFQNLKAHMSNKHPEFKHAPKDEMIGGDK